jgi:arylsulfatase A-like enzyme
MLPSRFAVASLFGLAVAASALGADRPPNVVIVYADDLGYGDLGCYGSKTNPTPNLDGIAKAGVRFTDFYVSQPVCSASRCALMTGCYSNRLGIHGALNPNSKVGIGDSEVTLGELFKSKGYATGIVGKWHLGFQPQFLPTKHGFDTYFGLPYSNDMWPHREGVKPGSYPNLPLIDGEKVVVEDVTAEVQQTLTKRYTERAVQFIGENAKKPFFLYFAHTFPHIPLFTSEAFRGKTKAGIYADVLAEVDWSVGEVLAALKKHGLEDDTLVVFSSDNGPWLTFGNHGGTAGPLREGKGTCFEGGVRVPCVARWPGKIPAGAVQTEPAMTIDVFPTVAKLIGAELPKHAIDGKDVWPLFAAKEGAKSPHEAYFFYYGTGELQAMRSGKWKLQFPHTARSTAGQEPGKDGKAGKSVPLKVGLELYDLSTDIGETKDVSAANPDVMKRLQGYADAARKDLGDSLTKSVGTGVREPGRVK